MSQIFVKEEGEIEGVQSQMFLIASIAKLNLSTPANVGE